MGVNDRFLTRFRLQYGEPLADGKDPRARPDDSPFVSLEAANNLDVARFMPLCPPLLDPRSPTMK
jgi:hypothetical protein